MLKAQINFKQFVGKTDIVFDKVNMTRLDANVVGTSLGYVEHNQTESRKSARPSFC